jgi:hypothetical protein
MRLRRACAFAPLPTGDMREFSSEEGGLAASGPRPVCTLINGRVADVDLDQSIQDRIEGCAEMRTEAMQPIANTVDEP